MIHCLPQVHQHPMTSACRGLLWARPVGHAVRAPPVALTEFCQGLRCWRLRAYRPRRPFIRATCLSPRSLTLALATIQRISFVLLRTSWAPWTSISGADSCTPTTAIALTPNPRRSRAIQDVAARHHCLHGKIEWEMRGCIAGLLNRPPCTNELRLHSDPRKSIA